eukprot:PhF_6_TR15964/c0_g1_i1/m.24915
MRRVRYDLWATKACVGYGPGYLYYVKFDSMCAARVSWPVDAFDNIRRRFARSVRIHERVYLQCHRHPCWHRSALKTHERDIPILLGPVHCLPLDPSRCCRHSWSDIRSGPEP